MNSNVATLQETERGCGFRAPGGIYLIGGLLDMACHRLPFNLKVCPVCEQGIKFSRGWRWLDAQKYLGDCKKAQSVLGMFVSEPECHKRGCFFCFPEEGIHTYGLLWVGERHYTPESFCLEAREMGVSKKISGVPREFEIGKTVVLLAHKKAGISKETKEPCSAIFAAFRPVSVQMVITPEQAEDTGLLNYLENRNIVPVIVEPVDEFGKPFGNDYEVIEEEIEKPADEDNGKVLNATRVLEDLLTFVWLMDGEIMCKPELPALLPDYEILLQIAQDNIVCLRAGDGTETETLDYEKIAHQFKEQREA